MSGMTRRRFIEGLGLATAGSVAGCLESANPGLPVDGNQSVQASFFVISDLTDHIVGDSMTVDTLVPFGQHGHGWEPGPSIQRGILDSDVFVSVGEGFQPWADKIIQNIHEDAEDITIIEAWADVDLLDASVEQDDSHDTDHEKDNDADHEDEHDPVNVDPHFWLDPARAGQAVQTIARGLRRVAPEHETVLMDNADTVTARLDEMDATFRHRLSGRTTDTVLFAGHNSFKYLGARYNVSIESLTDLAPDDTPTPKDITRAQSIIDEHDIEYVLAPVFETDRAAKQLVEETDADGVLPLTPVPTRTAEWRQNDWGFIDVMEQVNLDSLSKALGAE